MIRDSIFPSGPRYDQAHGHLNIFTCHTVCSVQWVLLCVDVGVRWSWCV